jgi:CPA2 family monovalent cation:H+ antiporter-2
METHLLQDLAVVMTAAGAMTLLCHYLKQPVVIGYLLAGFLIGPYTPPFSLISDLHSIHTMAELGLVFLLFSLGLEFNLPKIRKVGLSAGLAALLEVIAMLTIGYFVGQLFGWSKTDSIFLGAILSISSTTIIVKVFMDFKMIQEKFVQVVFGILVLEDIVAVAILSILSGLGSQGGPNPTTILFSFLRIGLFVTLFLLLGLFLVPKFLHWISKFKSKEVTGIVTLGICLGGALLAHFFNLSIALGAFLAGAVVAASKEIHEIEEWIHPVRDMFSAIFFVSAGMLIQPQLLWEFKWPIAVVTIATIFGKVISGSMGSFLAGYDVKTSARIGMSLAQIGEFSFVIASLGITLKVTSDFLYPLAVTVSSLTTLATPYLIRNSDPWVEKLKQIAPPHLKLFLNRYGVWLAKTMANKTKNQATAIFSKYLVRLGVYLAVLIAFAIFINASSFVILKSSQYDNIIILVFLWIASGLISLPLFKAISKYSNHILLLLVTRSKRLLHLIDVHVFYNTLHILTILVLVCGYLFAASQFVMNLKILIGMGISLLVFERLFRRKTTLGKEWLESVLDQVIGLATSEPTRQAVLKSGEHTLLLVDITDQITVQADSPVCHKTIREIKLREETGATIVAIYREGKHLANPGPDTQLEPDDIIVLLGNKEELEKAGNLISPQK